MKRIILIIIIFFTGACQKTNNLKFKKTNKKVDISFIQNNNIAHSIVLRACDTCVPISNIGYRVRVDITEEEKEIAKKINFNTWIFLLNNDTSDWAANLILSDLYSKDALLLTQEIWDNRDFWIKHQKHEDIQYWKDTLPSLIK